MSDRMGVYAKSATTIPLDESIGSTLRSGTGIVLWPTGAARSAIGGNLANGCWIPIGSNQLSQLFGSPFQ
jgi:hypothetical protein